MNEKNIRRREKNFLEAALYYLLFVRFDWQGIL